MSNRTASQTNYVVLEAIFTVCLYISNWRALIKKYVTESEKVREFLGVITHSFFILPYVVLFMSIKEREAMKGNDYSAPASSQHCVFD